MVECHLAKVDVEGSNPFSRSIQTRPALAGWPFCIFRDSVDPVLRPLRGLRTESSESHSKKARFYPRSAQVGERAFADGGVAEGRDVDAHGVR